MTTKGLTDVIRAVTVDPTIRVWRARSGFACVIFQGLTVLGDLFVPHDHVEGWERYLILASPGLLALALLAPEMFRWATRFVPSFGNGGKS